MEKKWKKWKKNGKKMEKNDMEINSYFFKPHQKY